MSHQKGLLETERCKTTSLTQGNHAINVPVWVVGMFFGVPTNGRLKNGGIVEIESSDVLFEQVIAAVNQVIRWLKDAHVSPMIQIDKLSTNDLNGVRVVTSCQETETPLARW
ncbi:hypothetical protein PIIN_11177 [Serendipita indica DSM 11827]|uniref:Uncharacterized protein n=1 Tax=Serendipita indica (strain DSM 11827) TaxID=1109443 RepID=G4U0V2_SERID|nr:hypothetical protein PIIN_11177 [Serendipita indica DSM 11827]